MIWFTADCHLGHALAAKLRGYDTVEHHDGDLINNWNFRVKDDDEVYVVGDFIWKHSQYEFYLSQLNGKIFLVPGDHDQHIADNDKFKVLPKVYLHKPTQIVMCHWPMTIWPMSHYGTRHIYGHMHERPVPYKMGKSYHVGVDDHILGPVSIDFLEKSFDELPENINLVRKFHAAVLKVPVEGNNNTKSSGFSIPLLQRLLCHFGYKS